MKPINQPIHTKIGSITYDSQFEARIATALQPLVYAKVGIKVHQKVFIKPATQEFKARYWSCDFVLNKDDRELLIEAKGFPDPKLMMVMEMLDYFNSAAYENTLIVIPRGFKYPSSWEKLGDRLIDEPLLMVRVKRWLMGI
jgi:hypothetical protein